MGWICSASKGKPEGYSNLRGKPAGLKDSKSPTRWLQELLLVCVGLLRSSSRVFSLVCTPRWDALFGPTTPESPFSPSLHRSACFWNGSTLNARPIPAAEIFQPNPQPVYLKYLTGLVPAEVFWSLPRSLYMAASEGGTLVPVFWQMRAPLRLRGWSPRGPIISFASSPKGS